MNIELLNKISKNVYLFKDDEIEYILSVKNDYDYTISNLEISYLPFNSLKLINQKIEGNTKVFGNLLNKDTIKVPKLLPNSSFNIIVTIKVSKSLQNNLINLFQVRYLDSNKDLKLHILNAEINILNDNLSVKFINSNKYPVKGETSKVKIIIQNDNFYSISNLNLAGYLDSKVKIIQNSLKINNILSNDYIANSSLLDINSLSLKSYEKITISFDLEHIEDGKIENKFLLNYYFNVYNYVFNKSKDLFLNYVCYNDLDLVVKKVPSKKFVTIEDILSYKIEVKNNKNAPIYNLILSNFIPSNCELIKDSFKIDNKNLSFNDGEKEIGIGTIPGNKKTILTYSLKILKCNKKRKLENTLNLSYKYVNKKNILKYKTLTIKDDGENTVFLGISSFKYLNIDKFLKINPNKPKIKKIEEINSTVTIKNHHVALSEKAKSNENQNLTGFQVIIFGTLNLSLKYTAKENASKLYFDFFEIPFSSFIVLPENYNEKNKIDLFTTIENNTFSLIYNDTISYGTDILIHADVY